MVAAGSVNHRPTPNDRATGQARGRIALADIGAHLPVDAVEHGLEQKGRGLAATAPAGASIDAHPGIARPEFAGAALFDIAGGQRGRVGADAEDAVVAGRAVRQRLYAGPPVKLGIMTVEEGDRDGAVQEAVAAPFDEIGQ